MDKRALILTGLMLVIPLILLAIWALQSRRPREEFARALQAHAVQGVHRDLQNKNWSEDELATIEVLTIPVGTGPERALTRAMHARGRIFLSANAYEYQATLLDGDTGIVHVFGYRRNEPRHWCWVQMHPDSLPLQIERRVKQADKMVHNLP